MISEFIRQSSNIHCSSALFPRFIPLDCFKHQKRRELCFLLFCWVCGVFQGMSWLSPLDRDCGVPTIKNMEIKPHNFWYAVNNTEIVLMPKNHLETFGITSLHYHMVSELMDSVNRIRVREGIIQSRQPQIITPSCYANEALDGFGEQANRYIDWLRDHAKDLRILEYGYRVQKTEINEHVVNGNVKEILDQVKTGVRAKNDPFTGVILGIDDPWDVCILKFMVDVIRQSMPRNVEDLNRRHFWDDSNGVPKGVRADIEQDFLAASRDSARMKPLAAKLRRYGLFEEYEDRFFELVRRRP